MLSAAFVSERSYKEPSSLHCCSTLAENESLMQTNIARRPADSNADNVYSLIQKQMSINSRVLQNSFKLFIHVALYITRFKCGKVSSKATRESSSIVKVHTGQLLPIFATRGGNARYDRR